MLPESFQIKKETLRLLREAKKDGCRVVAVGTTVTRVLESLPDPITYEDVQDSTTLFIKPGFHFRTVDTLITNLHVPRSKPLSLVSAFSSLGMIETAYQSAIENRYRFFSYGDAMMIL